MTTLDCSSSYALNRRQVLALLAAFGVTRGALAQDAPTTAPRSYRVVLENDRVRVLEHKSRPGFGVCGEGMHYSPRPCHGLAYRRQAQGHHSRWQSDVQGHPGRRRILRPC